MTRVTSPAALAAVLAAVAAAGIVAGGILEVGFPGTPSLWVFIAVCLVAPTVGWLIAARRPDNVYGWLLLAAADCLGLGAFGAGLLLSDPTLGGPLAVVATVLSSLFPVFYGLSWIFVPLFFPDGRLPSRRWRAGAWIAAVAITVHWAGILLSADAVYEPIFSRGNPIGLRGTPGLLVALAGAAGQAVTFLVALTVLGSLVLRWWRADAAGRRVLRWMIAGLTGTLGGFLLITLFGPDDYGLGLGLGLFASVAALPIVIVTTVFRHQLLDIKVGIRGHRIFLVFDLRPTVDELLTELGPALETEPVEQLGRLAGAVQAGLETRWAAVELADGTRVVAGEEDGEAAFTVPAGLGRIVCGPKVVGRLTSEDRRVLGALAVPVGLAIQSVGLAARLVNAQEAERRRIERNIHDGVQQQLVALIAGLELARATGGDARTLTLLREEARQTLTDLRELAAGIHPSVLSQGGLVEAVEERCSRLPVATTVTAEPGLRARRFPDEIEGALYFTVSESIANALKHARASRIEVRLTQAEGRLQAVVSDDGRGFDPVTADRGGLGALADRMNALGGGLRLTSAPGEGTVVRAWVPA
ncbi:sensor histidine kinase [Streptosporangium saharense]|uniref:Signal transduction histidine kinase n=1 Tax=Streptosporangium saharense TaxID=1706840 RepID=A0A7W7QUP3_9ACTN|nr:histidine kinase [Streptosporangium saharense]MBB4920064.1 signal transduction histidine kinase [Streptosporangium saharense]